MQRRQQGSPLHPLTFLFTNLASRVLYQYFTVLGKEVKQSIRIHVSWPGCGSSASTAAEACRKRPRAGPDQAPPLIPLQAACRTCSANCCCCVSNGRACDRLRERRGRSPRRHLPVDALKLILEFCALPDWHILLAFS